MTGAIAPQGGHVRVFFMDETRFGQQGTTTDVSVPTGTAGAAILPSAWAPSEKGAGGADPL